MNDRGIVSRIEGERYLVIRSAGPTERPFPGAEFELRDTYCELTMRADGPIGFANTDEGDAHLHPCHDKFGLRAYLGAPIRNRSGVFGTLNFSSVERRAQPFSPVDIDVIQLMATWIGGELERRELEQTVETIHGMIPICSSCKRIRSNLGGWHQLEAYLSEHVKLSFTHGVCPTCIGNEPPH